MKKIISLLMVLAVICSCSACSAVKQEKQRFTASFLDLFDTASTIIAYDDSQESFDKHYEQFYNRLQMYDRLFDIYHAYDGINNLYAVNRDAGTAPVRVESAVIDLLEYGIEVYTLSEGKTNICFGPVLALWHTERESAKENTARLPDESKLKKASEHTDINDLVIDREASTVFFKDPKMRLDVGAIAKGFAVREVTDWASQHLWSSAAISIGGNVSTIGYKNDDGKTPWTIGIENPDLTADDYLLKVNINDMCVVTSGDYQRYYEVNGKKYCHIINPDTLMPSDYMSAVSVICSDSALGDALSTTLFNMSIDDGKVLVESIDGVEAVWSDNQYRQTMSSGFEEYIKK